MTEAALSQVFAALADPTRREILRTLRRGRAPVHELAARFAISRPAVSKHLAVLRASGLVREMRAGRENVYELERARLSAAHGWLSAFWRDRLARLKALAEDDDE